MQYLTALLCMLFSLSLFSQDLTEEMRVVHCTAIDQTSSVNNIFIYDDKRVAVSTDKGIYLIFSPDNSTKIRVQGHTHLALHNYPCGNKEVHLFKDAVVDTTGLESNKINLTGGNKITCTYVNDKQDQAWIGTSEGGLYHFDIKSQRNPVFIENFNTGNSKLKSNHINNLLIDRYDRIWAGSKSGVLYGNDDKWKLYEQGSDIVAIDAIGKDVWIMAEDILYMVDEKNRWIDGDFVNSVSAGEVKDIEFDKDARLWIASESITRYNVEDDVSRTFNRANGFSSRKVNCIKMDEDKGLWVGTADQGLFLIQKEKLMTVTCRVEKGLDCEGVEDNAALVAEALGGTAPYRYKWSNGFRGGNPQNLGPGTYTVTISDSDGQNGEASAIIEDPRMKASAEALRIASSSTAKDGRAYVVVEGGTPDYSYLWDNGEKTETARTLTPGKHTVSILDKSGCKTTATVEIDHKPDPKPEEIPALVVMFNRSGQNVCPGDANVNLEVKVEGGKAPYQYKWSKPSFSGKTAKAVSAGNYALTVSDASGQTATQGIAILAPASITASVAQLTAATRAGSRDGQARVKASGGAGNFAYLWDNNESRARAIRLIPGKHTVTISDAKGCEVVASVSISTKRIPELDANKVVEGQTIRLENLYFEADSTKLTEHSKPTLNEVFAFLDGNPNITVEIGGHTNNIPSHEYCDRLSSQRAKSISDYIIDKGIEASRIAFKGYGKRKPVASNSTSEGRRKNQRVEVKILSTK